MSSFNQLTRKIEILEHKLNLISKYIEMEELDETFFELDSTAKQQRQVFDLMYELEKRLYQKREAGDMSDISNCSFEAKIKEIFNNDELMSYHDAENIALGCYKKGLHKDLVKSLYGFSPKYKEVLK